MDDAVISEGRAVDWAGACALMYMLAALDEVEAETAKFLRGIHRIKKKYRAELEAGNPAQFQLLCAAVERGGMIGGGPGGP